MGTYRSAKILQKEDCTEYLLQRKLRTFRSNPQYICEGLYIFDWESDMLLKTRSGLWYEVECKISFQDFKHDFTKEEKHIILQRGERYRSAYRSTCHMEGSVMVREQVECGTWRPAKRPNYFSYCVPWYLEDKVTPLVPDYAGLVILKQNGALNEVKKPPLLHKEKYKDESLHLHEKFYYRWRNILEHLEQNSQHERINQLLGQIALLKAEYKAATGVDYDEYLKDAL